MTGQHHDDGSFDDASFDDAGFDDVISLLRDGPIEMTDEQPTPSLWAGIAVELGLSMEDGDDADQSTTGDVADRSTAPHAGAAPAGADDNVIDLATRRPGWGRTGALVTLAAAVVLLLAVPVGLALRSGDDVEVIAAADLDLLEGQDGAPVSAELVSIDGDLQIEVGEPTTVADGEFLELWLLEVDGGEVAALESLGRVDGSGRYDVPDDIDLGRFRVVDISVEPDDGNPDHSGVSVVRGELA